MREWSLHILDLVENSLRAGARHIRVAVKDRPDADRLELSVDDDGPGLPEDAAEATDPFYTTKPGKRTGLGLSLIRFQAEQAGGGLTLDRSDLGGLSARAVLVRSHVDRNPLGDLASTLCGVVATGGDDLELEVRLERDGRCSTVRTADLRVDGRSGLELAIGMQERVRQMVSDLSIDE